MTTLINIFGGPSAGKTTLSLGLTYALKMAGYKAEYVHEVAKYPALVNDIKYFDSQYHVTNNQHKLLSAYLDNGDLDFVITDAPLPLGLIYGEHYGKLDKITKEAIEDLCCSVRCKSVVNILKVYDPEVAYDPVGRYQIQTEAHEIHRKMTKFIAGVDHIQIGKLNDEVIKDLVTNLIKRHFK